MRHGPAIALSVLLASPLAAGDTTDLPLDWPGVGGLSAIELREDGASALLLSDRGQLHEIALSRQDGRLTGATLLQSLHLAPDDVPGRHLDPEGLALFPGGDLAISFEDNAPLRLHPADGGAMRQIALPPRVRLAPNAMYEALAVDPQGRLVMLPEDPGQGGPDHPVWRLENGRWQEVARLATPGGYRPVGADFGPDGQLYLLLRALGFGFRAMVLRFDPAHPEVPARRILHLADHPRSNFEGLSVWQDPQGTLRLLLVSDNNFSPLLEQRLLEIALDLQGPSR
ncbi:esterase-like activity of phytase family protein [Oceanicola sp. S124]|uniref:esterase-like activity of phytase family protein n=1 Tax=Oceanicola sp. S124 TaxID=1042378 RepID=UPI0002558966|nr:esterase-like activity of phytase family protein [Oceanicola sp. S124]